LKLIALVLSVVLFAQLNLLALPACADAVSFTPGGQTTSGELQGKVPAKVGALLAADAMIILNGRDFKIDSKTSSTSAATTDLLAGILLNPKIEGSPDSKNITGYAFFTGGAKYERLLKTHCHESVSLYNGTELTGKISSINSDSLTIDTASGPQKVAIADISAIHSARAYKFSMPVSPSADPAKPIAADVPKLVFTPTCVTISGGVTKSSTVKKVLIVMAAAGIVATAIAVPIAVATASHHHHSSNPIFLPQQNTAPKLPVITPTVVRPPVLRVPTTVTVTKPTTVPTRPVITTTTTTSTTTTIVGTSGTVVTVTTPPPVTTRPRFPIIFRQPGNLRFNTPTTPPVIN
jgi:hypothetical protein